MSTPGTVNYPSSLDDVVSLLEAANGAQTTLTAPLTDSATTASVASTTRLPATGAVTFVDRDGDGNALSNEICYYTGKTSNSLTGLIRGRDGTTAAAHDATTTTVEAREIARHHNVLAEALIATQSRLDSHTHSFASLANLPTTVAGFGITDVYDKGEVDDAIGALTSATISALAGKLGLHATADLAAALSTPRNINGVAFDGTANITVAAAAGTLTGGTLASNVLSSSLTSVGTLVDLTVTNPITGSITGSSGSTTGNAATATALATARNINGVAFDGTGNITVAAAAGTLTGGTLASNVLASSLTSVGTLLNLTVTNTITGSISGNAATATALATARAINGVNFDGTAAITVAAAAGTVTGTTLASNVVTSSLTSVGTIGTGVWQGTIVTSAFGGTGNGFTKFSGPAASEKTFTLPNASATILTDNAAVSIAQGGTGQVTAANAINALLPTQTSNSGKFLTTDGSVASWATVSASDATKLPLAGGTMTGTLTHNPGVALTANAPAIDIAQTWNNAAVGFIGFNMIITDTSSNSSTSFPIMVKRDTGTVLFSVSRSSAAVATTFECASSTQLAVSGLLFRSGRTISWSSTTAFSGTADTGITRSAAGVVEDNNGTAGSWRDHLSRSYLMNGLEGAAAAMARKSKAVTTIADNTATATFTVTVPNAAHSANIELMFRGALGAGGAIGAGEATAAATYNLAIARTAGLATVATLSTAMGATTSAVAGAATITLTAAVSGLTGANSATQTFTINVTIARGSGSSTNHTCDVLAEVMNANATGITIA